MGELEILYFFNLVKPVLQNWSNQFLKTAISALRPDTAIVLLQNWSNKFPKLALSTDKAGDYVAVFGYISTPKI